MNLMNGEFERVVTDEEVISLQIWLIDALFVAKGPVI